MSQEKPTLSPEMKTVLGHLNQQMARMQRDLMANISRLEARLESPSGSPASASGPSLVPGSKAVHFNDLGVQLYYQQELTESVANLEKATTEDANLIEAWNNLAMAYSSQGRSEEAKAAFAKAVALDPDRTEVLNNQAVMALLTGDADEALAVLERAKASSSRRIPMLLNLAQAYQEKEEHARAVRAWKMVTVIDPSHEEAKQNLRQYYQ